jgi:hypothetical protein
LIQEYLRPYDDPLLEDVSPTELESSSPDIVDNLDNLDNLEMSPAAFQDVSVFVTLGP